jgi:hypothetical protein
MEEIYKERKYLGEALEIFKKYSVPITKDTLFSIDGSPLQIIPIEYLDMEKNDQT